MMKRLGLITAVSIGIAAAVFAQSNQRGAASVAPGDWHNINRDSGATRFSPLNQINAGNVANLKQAWTFAMTGGGSSVPLVVNGVMFVSSGRRVVAIDGETGKEVWEFTLPAPAAPPAVQQAPAAAPPAAAPAGAPAAGAAPGQGDGRRGGGPGGGGRAGGGPGGGGGGRGGGGGPTASQRGVSYWPGDGANGPRILFMGGNRLYAIDAATGKPAAGFGENGSIAVGAVSYGGTPTIYRNVAIIGAATQEVPEGPPGNPRAFDVVTGVAIEGVERAATRTARP